MGDTDGEDVIDISIESLTGTVYDLCVSPFETILGIKLKIQRLEGIPAYQQQLVYGSSELQDDMCLDECRVQPGAQLKLLVAMRGGPIHAHRVHLDLEEPTLLEIAELLETDGDSDHKYTVMLLRDGDALDVADLLQVYSEEGCESVSCSPVQVSESCQHVNVATSSNSTQMEHALTKDKMKELMRKLKKLRGFRGYQSMTGSGSSGGRYQGKGAPKVLILDSRASSRLLSSSHQSPLPPTCAGHRLSAQRRLLFTPDDCSCCKKHHHQPHRHHRHRAAGRNMGKRSRSPERETPPLLSRGKAEESSRRLQQPPQQQRQRQPVSSSLTLPTPQRERDWRREAKRARRSSSLVENAEQFAPEENDSIAQLTSGVSRLAVGCRERSSWLQPERGRVKRTDQDARLKDRDRRQYLPELSVEHRHFPLTCTATSTSRRQSGHNLQRLPPLVAATTAVMTKPPIPKRRSRCVQCGKKTGLASSYTCRCGGLFCALHRYAETHSCTFDYKTEGQHVIGRNNPVITAPKLPKI